eukprot:m.326177 g.326177  ORF g.326177 m.326177 type:complete len:229 (+) comp19741_c0_seq19:614-1300(+)
MFKLPSLIWDELQKPQTKGVVFFTTVLFSLSTSMVLSGCLVAGLLRWSHKPVWRDVPTVCVGVCLVVTLVTFAISESVLTYYNDNPDKAVNVNAFLRVLAVPGRVGKTYVLYVLFPWLGVCTMGCAMGFVLALHRTAKSHLRLISAIVSVTCLVLFAILRATTSFGSLQGAPSHPNGVQFLNVVKYPPSITYTLITFGEQHPTCCPPLLPMATAFNDAIYWPRSAYDT